MKRFALPAALLALALVLSACRAQVDVGALPTPIATLSAADFPAPTVNVAQAQPAAPTAVPTAAPTTAPTEAATEAAPAEEPDAVSAAETPTAEPTAAEPAPATASPQATAQAGTTPTESPAAEPTAVEPAAAATTEATVEPTVEATVEPAAAATETPAEMPTAAAEPTAAATEPAVEATAKPVVAATEAPTAEPAAATVEPAAEPAAAASSEDPYAGLPDAVKAAMATADPSRGETLATQNACQACHSLQEGQVLVGPSWFDIGNHAATRVEGESAAVYLYNSIAHPNDFVVEGFMPNLMVQTFAETLTDQQMADLIAYLLSLKAAE